MDVAKSVTYHALFVSRIKQRATEHIAEKQRGIMQIAEKQSAAEHIAEKQRGRVHIAEMQRAAEHTDAKWDSMIDWFNVIHVSLYGFRP